MELARAKSEIWLAFLDTARTERFQSILALAPRVSAVIRGLKERAESRPGPIPTGPHDPGELGVIRARAGVRAFVRVVTWPARAESGHRAKR